MSIFGGVINTREVSGSFNIPYAPSVNQLSIFGDSITATALGKYSIIQSKFVYVNITINITAASGTPLLGITVPFDRADPSKGSVGSPFGAGLYHSDIFLGVAGSNSTVNPGSAAVIAAPIILVPGTAVTTGNKMYLVSLVSGAAWAANTSVHLSGLYTKQ